LRLNAFKFFLTLSNSSQVIQILPRCCLGRVYVFEKYAPGIVYSFKKISTPVMGPSANLRIKADGREKRKK
jgi:hypothetical protein